MDSATLIKCCQDAGTEDVGNAVNIFLVTRRIIRSGLLVGAVVGDRPPILPLPK